MLFFGSLADRLGVRERTVDAPEEGVPLSRLRELLADGDAEALAALQPPVRAAVDQQIAAGDPRVRDGQEVAFFPLFSGG